MNKTRNKKNRGNIITRFRNRNSLPIFPDKKAQDEFIIDTTLKELYNDGDRTTKTLKNQILQPHRIKISAAEYERIWEILMSTGLVNGIIGFGNAGKLTLTNEGYQLMRQFGSYDSFLAQKEKQQQQPGVVMPQFIITQTEEQEEEKAQGKSKGNDTKADENVAATKQHKK